MIRVFQLKPVVVCVGRKLNGRKFRKRSTEKPVHRSIHVAVSGRTRYDKNDVCYVHPSNDTV